MPWREILEHAPRWIWRFVAVSVVVLFVIQMWRGDAVVCPNGAVFAKSCSPIAVDMPDGAVVAFDRQECPSGWREFDDAEGRFIVGTGRHSEFDRYGVELTELQLEDMGGDRTHRLSIAEMPAHTHRYTFSSGQNSPDHVDFSDNEFGMKDRPMEETTPAGDDQPHNNMPPFVALRFCAPVSEP